MSAAADEQQQRPARPPRPDEERRRAQIERSVEIGNAVAEEVPLAEFLTPGQMLDRCVHVVAGKRVAILPESETSGEHLRLLTVEEFVEAYGSSGEPAGNGWAAYTRGWRISPRRKTVKDVAMAIGRPRMLTALFGGTPVMNIWTPRERKRPSARGMQLSGEFWRHVEYLVPIEEERRVFRQWLAHCEQRPAVLPHHGWLMVTESFGVGRNWMAAVLARVWRGEVAPNVNIDTLINGNFNGLISGKRFAIVNECFIDSAAGRHAAESRFRDIITTEEREINQKYGRQYYEWNVLRWLLLTNYWNAMPMPDHDRRLRVVENPKEVRPGDYYARLYAMLEDEELIEAVAYDLATTDLRDFNPGAPPPTNEAKRKVIAAGRSDFETDVLKMLKAWPEDVAAVDDLFRLLDTKPEEKAKAGSQLAPIMRKIGWSSLGRFRLGDGNGKQSIWLRGGRPEPDDAAAAVRAYRNADWFQRENPF